jgi:thioredoxin-related protein
MKWILILGLAMTGLSLAEWQTDFETAKKMAKEKDRYILLNFSGSDWCIPCIRLRKEVFDSEEFVKLADSSLVLLHADFPRNKKNQLPKDLQRKNDALAERYNPSGQFPLTLLLTPEGKVVRTWEGYPKNNAGFFINEVKSVCDAYHH